MEFAACPDARSWFAFATGLASDLVAAEMGQHLDSCPHCQRLLAQLEIPPDSLIPRLRQAAPWQQYVEEPELTGALAETTASREVSDVAVDDQGGRRSFRFISFASLPSEMERVCADFEKAWKSCQEPKLDDYIQPFQFTEPSVHQQLLIELVAIDLKYRWRRSCDEETRSAVHGQIDHPPERLRLTDYVARFSGLGLLEDLPLELVAEEYRARRRWGEVPTHGEYLAAFHERRAELEEELCRIDGQLDSVDQESSAECEREQHRPEPLPFHRIRDYEILARLGEGGMGAVYKARHARLSTFVAVKVLSESRTADPEAIARFEREMRAFGELRHPNIVQALDAGEENGMHYLAMEYIDGWNLTDLLRHAGPLAVADVCELVRQAAVGFEHAQKRGCIHRDIKPSNLMLSKDGTVKILDLGLALLREDQAAPVGQITSTSQVMGTLDYLAPEQAVDTHSAGTCADIYSLGCTLYHLLAGRPPFSGPGYESLAEKLAGHARDPAPPIHDLRPDVPEELVRLMDRMLAKKPRDRPQTSAEVAEALQPLTASSNLMQLIEVTSSSSKLLHNAGGVATTAPLPRPAVPAAGVPTARRRTDPRTRQRRRALVGAGLAAVVLISIILVVAERHRVSEWYRSVVRPMGELPHVSIPAGVNGQKSEEPAEGFEEASREDPDARQWVSRLVSRQEFDGAMQAASEAPLEEQRALRGTIRNAWLETMKNEWDSGQIRNVSNQCDRYLTWFPAEEEASSVLVWLLLADCHMRLRPTDWEQMVSAILHTVRTFEDGDAGFLGKAKAEWKTKLIQLRFDVFRQQNSTLEERIRLLAEYDSVKEHYLAEEAVTDVVHAGVDPLELDSYRRQIIVQVARSITAAWTRLSEGQLAEAHKVFAIVDPIAAESAEVSGWEPLRAVFDLHEQDTPPDSISAAIDVLDEYLATGCEDRHRIVIADALGQVAERDDEPLLEEQVLRAIRMVRAQRLHDAAGALSRLWERCIRMWLDQGSVPPKDDLVKLGEDAAWLSQASRGNPLLDLAVAYWRPDQDETIQALQSPVGDLPEELALFSDYLRLRALSMKTKPDFDAVVSQAAALLTNPRGIQVLELHGRLAEAASAALRACVQQQQEELTPFGSYPYLKPATAQRHAQLLGAAERLPPKTLKDTDRRSLQKSLALALASEERPDWARVWEMAHRAASGFSGEGLLVDEAALCDACVRSYLKLPADTRRDPDAGLAATRAGLRLLGGVVERGGLPEATAVALYRELLEPLREQLGPLRELAKTAQSPAGAAADLERYYAALGEFIELHRFAPFAHQATDHEKANARLREGLFHWALYLHSKKPERNPQTLAGYYVQRGHARAQLAKADLSGALRDAKDARLLQPDLPRAHGLIAHALLVRSREQLTLKEKRDDLDGAILAGLKVRESADDLDNHTKAVLWLNLSYAYLERANFVRDPSFQRQKDDLQKALHFAQKAAGIPQRYPEYPLIAKGHAYEDLAWIAEDRSEENYRKAVLAFQEADRHMILGVAPKLATARSLYKAVSHTQLHPRQVGPFNSNEEVYAEVENLLNQCIEVGKRSGTIDPAVLLYLGNVAEVQERFQAADDYFEAAWRHASEQALPSRATFAVRWATFPFSRAQWKPEERQAEALRRAAALAGVPVAPGGKPDPAKEAALILAQVDQMRDDRTSALARLDAALPETVDDAEWPDLGLLLLRANLRASAALEPESPAWNVAKAALDDVERAYAVAVTRFDLAGACQQAFLVYHHVHAAVDRHRTAPSELPTPAQLSTRAQDHLETWYTLVRRSEGLSDACETMALMAGKEAERVRPPAHAPDRVGGLEEELKLWQAADVWMKRAAGLTDDDAKRRRRGEHGTTLAEIIKRVREELDRIRKQQAPTPRS